MLCKDPKTHERRGWCQKQCCRTNNKHEHKDKMFSEADRWRGIHNRSRVHCKHLTCELTKRNCPNRAIYLPAAVHTLPVSQWDERLWQETLASYPLRNVSGRRGDAYMKVRQSEVDLSPKEMRCVSTAASRLRQSEQHDFELTTWSKPCQNPQVQSRKSDLRLRALCPQNYSAHICCLNCAWNINHRQK